MRYIRKRALAGDLMLDVGANLGSSLTVEMIGAAGFVQHIQSYPERKKASLECIMSGLAMNTATHPLRRRQPPETWHGAGTGDLPLRSNH